MKLYAARRSRAIPQFVYDVLPVAWVTAWVRRSAGNTRPPVGGTGDDEATAGLADAYLDSLGLLGAASAEVHR